MTRVLDASALLAYLEREGGHGKISSALTDAIEKESPLLISAVNWGEVCYIVERNFGAKKIDEIKHLLGSFPIDIAPVDGPLAEQAARLKCRYKLGYADALAGALALELKAVLYTSDREFQAISRVVKIEWV